MPQQAANQPAHANPQPVIALCGLKAALQNKSAGTGPALREHWETKITQ